MIKVNDTWFRVLLVLFFFGFSLYITLATAPVIDGTVLTGLLLSLATLIAACEGTRFLILRTRAYAQQHRRFPRMLVLIPSGIVYLTLVLSAGKALRNYVSHGEWRLWADTGSNFYVNNTKLTVGVLGTSLVYAVLLFFFLLAIYQTLHYFARLRHTEKERDRFEKEKLRAELQQLKGIVNPHFLFNNLNSLSALISEQPDRAEAFLDELTKVFRYLLRNNDTDLTTLGTELQFLQSYYHLLQTRFGGGIRMTIQADAAHEALLLPPLTLQLLVENAVKHNHVHVSHPLHIEIFTVPNRCLVVRNNISKKESSVESTGIGLQSINTRYRMLGHQGVAIEQNEKMFSVQIPLLEAERLPPQTRTALEISNAQAVGI